jgi:hypothetical protein
MVGAVELTPEQNCFHQDIKYSRFGWAGSMQTTRIHLCTLGGHGKCDCQRRAMYRHVFYAVAPVEECKVVLIQQFAGSKTRQSAEMTVWRREGFEPSIELLTL